MNCDNVNEVCIMVQFEELKLKLEGLKPEIDDLSDALGLSAIKSEIQQLENRAAEPGFYDDIEKSQKILKRTSDLNAKVDNFNSLVDKYEDTLTLIELGDEEEDLSLLEEAESEVAKVEEILEKQRLQTLLTGEYDKNNAILTFHAGSGGTEAQDWAEMLYRMYTRWAADHGFNVKEVDYLEGDEAGLKSADVYGFQYDYLLAKDKYLQAADYFKQAGNKRSEGLALAEVGKMYVFSDSIDAGLQQILNSKRIFESINNKRCISLSYNHIGNVYMYLKKYDLAEEHFLKSIEIGDDENSSSYLALAGVYTNLSQWEKALDCLEKAKKPSLNKNVQNDIFYHYYLIYNAQGKYKEAVSYLDKYVDLIAGSTKTRNKSKVASIENRYRQSKYQMDNIQLKADKAQLKLLGVLGLLLIVIVFAYFRSRFSKKIYHQRLELERKNVSLSDLQKRLTDSKIALNRSLAELRNKQQTLDMVADYQNKINDINTLIQQIKSQRLTFFKEAAITQKLIKLSSSVVPNKTGKSLTEQDWEEVMNLLNFSYPKVIKKGFEVNLTKTERELYYLSLFDLGASGEAVLMGCSFKKRVIVP